MGSKWSEEEDQYLLANYGNQETTFLSKVLERSSTAIERRYKSLQQEMLPAELDYILSRSKRAVPKRTRKLKEGKGTISTAKVSNWSGKGNPYAHTKSGFRTDLDITVRSGWEANVLRILKAYDIDYEFEPRVFTFPIKRGNRAYTPDIFLKRTGEWIEVKGYLDKNSQIKLKRFKKYYPEEFETMAMIISKSSKQARDFAEELAVPNVLFYEELGRLFKGKIKTWEGR